MGDDDANPFGAGVSVSDTGALSVNAAEMLRSPNAQRNIAAARRLSLSGHQSSHAKSVDWLTPLEWIRALGDFSLDPCCPKEMPWRTAAEMWHESGLERPWFGRVWLNPPFGRDAAKWLRKMRDHGNGIALIPARTETAMFHESVWDHASAICFVKGRPHFHTTDGLRAPFNSGAPIALVAYDWLNMMALRRANLGPTLFLNAA